MTRRTILRAVLNWRFLAIVLMLGVFAYNTIKRMPTVETTDGGEKGDVDGRVPASMVPILLETRMRVYLTAYSYWDNTPPRTTIIAHPVLHGKAGGIGTYRDPVTIAVGHKIEAENSIPDYPPGTRFYLPRLQKYAIVEDLCGDGESPQQGPCHIGYRGHPWLDLYIGGASHDSGQAEICGRRITGLQPAIMHPQQHYSTIPGEVLSTKCEFEPVSSR